MANSAKLCRIPNQNFPFYISLPSVGVTYEIGENVVKRVSSVPAEASDDSDVWDSGEDSAIDSIIAGAESIVTNVHELKTLRALVNEKMEDFDTNE